MPSIRPLPKKPLIEAIFEIRWKLESDEDYSNYSLFLGRLYDKVQNQYPFHEALPSSSIPTNMSEGIIQHRFRKGNNEWPLVQIGPGIVSANDTEGYIWKDFGKNTKAFVKSFYEAYPKPDTLKITGLQLRYIDGFPLEHGNRIFEFLSKKLKTTISFAPKLFENVPVSQIPKSFNCITTFSSEVPSGSITLRFASGKFKNDAALIMEITFSSSSTELPKMPEGFEEWIEKAHNLTDDWFFKLIEGELERRFADE